MMIVVVHSLFMLVILHLIIVGEMVLLYHGIITSYYTLRGGRSSAGTDCGTFYVIAGYGAGFTDWHIGAALDCFILCSSWR